jgi:hypothetical protein
MRLALRQASLLVTTAGLIRLTSQTNKSANRRGRLPGGLKAFGHTVRLLPPGYVKPYVKRQKARNGEFWAAEMCGRISPLNTSARGDPLQFAEKITSERAMVIGLPVARATITSGVRVRPWR